LHFLIKCMRVSTKGEIALTSLRKDSSNRM
jgi:hypothetical protein